jgi:hypothetical protein
MGQRTLIDSRTFWYRKVEYDHRELMSIEALIDLVDGFRDYRDIDRSAVDIVELPVCA